MIPIILIALGIILLSNILWMMRDKEVYDPYWCPKGYTKLRGIISSKFDDKIFVVVVFPDGELPNHIIEIPVPSGLRYYYTYDNKIDLYLNNTTKEYKIKHPYENKFISSNVM